MRIGILVDGIQEILSGFLSEEAIVFVAPLVILFGIWWFVSESNEKNKEKHDDKNVDM